MTRSWRLIDIVQLLPISELLTVLGFLLALILLAHLLRSRKPPASTIAWLLTIVLMPYIGVPLYLMLGGRKMRRMADKKDQIYLPEDATANSNLGKPAERILCSFGVPPASAGNRVSLITSGEVAYRKLIQLIEDAERSIHITTYILGRDDVGSEIVERLTRKAASGVDVRLLLDDVGSWRIQRRLLEPLMSAGGRVAFFMPVFHRPFHGRANLRNHRKIFVVDDRIALTGGMNLAQEYLGPTPDPSRWRDVSLVIEGHAVADLVEIFLSDWSFATSAPLETRESPKLDPISGNSPVQVVASGPDVAGDPLYESLITLLFSAQKRIWVVTPYFVPDEILVRALDIAARRGVDVRLVVPNRSNHLTADLARVGYLREVNEAGGQIFRYLPVMIHAKVILIDDELAIIGSANMDVRSLFLNYEVALFLYDHEKVRDTEDWFNSLFPNCRPGLAHQTWLRELAENIVRLLSPLL